MSVMIFNHGGGGVSELAIKVVGGIVQPNGASGMIWVNTATAIPHWAFAVTQPASPAMGDIWVQTDATSANVINLLKANTAKVNVLRVKQYNGTLWISINAYYYSTSWTQISSSFNAATDITYTGTMSYINDGGGHWRIKLLTSGNLVFTAPPDTAIDSFLVGGGGSGGGSGGDYGGSGGGGGYTNTSLSITPTAGTVYPIVIGGGGSAATGSNAGNAGGSSTAFGYTAGGGYGAVAGRGAGGAGGSGGASGGYQYSTSQGGVGGANGSAGANVDRAGGGGQVATTKEFASASETVYSGGGGGGAGYSSGGGGAGGAGGGGTGGYSGSAGTAGTTNTGGGGGGKGNNFNAGYSGAGGSGIVVIRDHRA